MIRFLDLQAQYKSIQPDVDIAMKKVLDSSAYVLGPSVEAFEKDFATFCGAKHCIGLNSGTAALALLMQANGIGPGDEVITVANSFFASAEAISQIGATPVLVDCIEETALMNPDLLEAAITSKTKAIIPVHLYGQPADMDEILAIARKHNVLVFEDACQAHGAEYKGKRTGGLANGAAFSFYPGKNLGAYGDAGAITTNDDGVAARVRMLRDHGSAVKYTHEAIGWNERMDGLQGAVLGVKLSHLLKWNEQRRAVADQYRSLLPASVRTIGMGMNRVSAMHLFVIRIADRDRVQAELTAQGIQTSIHYPVPIHLQPAYKGRWKLGDFPVSERLAKDILSLPMYAELSSADVETVAKALHALA